MPHAHDGDGELAYEVHGEGEPRLLIQGLGGTKTSACPSVATARTSLCPRVTSRASMPRPRPRYRFGFGLSCTRFDYLGLTLSKSKLGESDLRRNPVKVRLAPVVMT